MLFAEFANAAGRALAAEATPREVSAEYIIPRTFNEAVPPVVAESIAHTAHQTGVARRRRRQEVAPVW